MTWTCPTNKCHLNNKSWGVKRNDTEEVVVTRYFAADDYEMGDILDSEVEGDDNFAGDGPPLCETCDKPAVWVGKDIQPSKQGPIKLLDVEPTSPPVNITFDGKSSPLQELADLSLALCKRNNWDRGWQEGGCAMFLEVAEFIEALRGKGDETATSEAGDILFVLLSMLEHRGIPAMAAVVSCKAKVLRLMEKAPYRNDEPDKV